MTRTDECDAEVEGIEESTVFDGTDQAYRLIGALCQRPRFGDRPRKLTGPNPDVVWGEPVARDERSERTGLPMVCLVGSSDPTNLAGAIDNLLNNAKRGGIRHALCRLKCDGDSSSPGKEWTPADVLKIRELLWRARNKLVHSKARGSRLRFPLFSLVYRLMENTKKIDDPNPDATARRLLREESVVRRIGHAVQAANKELGDGQVRWKVPFWLFYVLSLGVLRLALTGRVPLLSGRYRWFMRQPHLAPEMTGTFVRFAQRLIGWQMEAPEYVARLLVNAFLEDLRRAYRLRPWQIFRVRRMTYPVLLLDNITKSNGGYLLLRLINDVRNQVGTFDPLLVISVSRNIPPDAIDSPLSKAPAAVSGYMGWQHRLLKDRRARRKIAWYLLIDIPKSATDEARQALRAFDGFDPGWKAARPALWCSRWLRLGTAVVVLLSTATGLATWYQQHCGSWQASLRWTGSECVGISDGSFNLFQPSDPDIRRVEDTIWQQNQRAENLHRDSPRRIYITLADFLATTSSNNTSDGLTAEREALEGVARAQQTQLNKSGDDAPIVRILVVNGGRNMQQGPAVAAQLGKLAQQDPSLVGVIGLDMSSQQTRNTIEALGNAGLPVVSASLSEDNLGTGHPMYFQIAPQNQREAAVAAEFAAQQANTGQKPRTVRIYSSADPTDTYSDNLKTDVAKAFEGQGFQVTTKPFSPSELASNQSVPAHADHHLIGHAVDAGRDTCTYDGFVFFAGRGVPDYSAFLDGARQCQSHAVLIGDDDVSRFVADNNERQKNGSLSFYFLSFSIAPPIALEQGPQLDFYPHLEKQFSFEYNIAKNRSLDGHAALSYDAANVLIYATSYLRADDNTTSPITPAAVWREIAEIHVSNQNRLIDGVTGTIDYGGDITRQVPLNKPVAVLQVNGSTVNPTITAFCGTSTGYQENLWCPHDNGTQ